MDLEHLNKTQIVLLTLLVSFVTSIATGIFPFFLLAQAPPAVTQTINRIVERTVEKAVPTSSGGTTTVKETTVVVKEDDLITASIAKNAKSIVRIKKPVLLESGEIAERVVGLGVMLDAKGLIATDAGILNTAEKFTAITEDGTVFPLRVDSLNSSYSTGLATLLEGGTTKGYAFTPVTLGDPKSLKLGQSVLSLSGVTRQSVSTGIVGSLITESGTATSTAAAPVLFVDTSIIGSVTPGSPLINIFGEVIGISTEHSRARGSSLFTPSATLSAQMAALAKVSKEEAESQSAAVKNSR